MSTSHVEQQLREHRSALEQAVDAHLAHDHYRLSPGDKQFPCTLKGVNSALAEAQFLSIDGPRQTVTVVRAGRRRVIARFSHGQRADG